MKAHLPARSPRQAASFIEPLESRITPGTITTFPSVVSIDRAVPTTEGTAAASVTYTVTFDQPVTGVDATDFKVFTSVDAKATPPVTVATTANAAIYNVTISGLQGNGEVRLDLVDDDSIQAPLPAPDSPDVAGITQDLKLGGTGSNNGSFTGQTYHLLQTMPTAISIDATSLSAGTATWTVTFSEAVNGVDLADFELVYTGMTGPGTLATVTPSSGPATTYTVTASGITGVGTAGLNLLDNGTIKDTDKNPLQTVEPPNPPTIPAASFGQSQTAGAGNAPVSIAHGDVNGDGRADIAVANYADDTVTVLLGNGDGTFQTQQPFGTGNGPRSVALADVNGDGRPDLVVSGQTFDSQTSTQHYVSVLLGDGLGGFAPRTNWGNSFASPGAVAVGDMNHDGKPDLVVLTTSGNSTVNVLLGNGDGTFQTEQTFPVNASANDVQIADVNGDGRPDVVTANYSFESVSVFLGTGTGSLGTATPFDLGDVRPNAVAVGDVDGDGKPDLVAAGYDDDEEEGAVIVLLGDGQGNFNESDADDVGNSPSDVQLADFDGDGRLDVAVTDQFGGSVFVLRVDADGNLGSPRGFNSQIDGGEGLTVADFNGDGKADIASVGTIFGDNFAPDSGPAQQIATGGTAEVLLNNGTGPFTGKTFTIDAAPLDLTVTSIDDPALAVPGHNADFTVHYANLSTVATSTGSITVTLPANSSFVSGAGWTDNLDGTITASNLTVPPGGADQTLSYVLLVGFQNDTAPLSTTATISNVSPSDTNEENDSATEETPVYHGFIVTAPGISPKLNKFALPVVRVFDKLTGEEVYSFSAYEDTYRDSIRVALGDFNEDGIDDIVTTTQHNGGRLRVFDGFTGEQFPANHPLGPHTGNGDVLDPFPTVGNSKNKNKGAFVAVGDVNGYGLPEIVIGSSLITASVGGGTVQVYSLDSVSQPLIAELAKIKEFTPFGAKFKGGVRVAVADVDGFGSHTDGALPENFERPLLEDDIIVGQGYHGATVKVYKGTVITSTPGQEETFKLGEFKVGTKSFKGGVSVGADDIDHDGHADIIVGRNTGKPSVVEVFDGRTVVGAKLATKTTPAILPTQIGLTLNPFDTNPLHPKNTSGVRVAMADVTGDGIADIIASVGIKKNSLIKFYDGADFRNGIITPLADRQITAFSDFLDVALWVAASRTPISIDV